MSTTNFVSPPLSELSQLHTSLVSLVTMSLLLSSQVNSINISEDSSPLDFIERIFRCTPEVHLALLRNGEWGVVPTTHLPQPTIYTFDTLDDESCTTRHPSHLRPSPTPNRQCSPSGCGTGNTSFGKGVDARKHGQHLCNHSDDDSSDSYAMVSPINQSHNGNVKQLVTTEPGGLWCPPLIGCCLYFVFGVYGYAIFRLVVWCS